MRFTLSPVASVEGEQVLSLDAAKAHVRVLHEDEDDLIASLRDAAINIVQQHTGKSLTDITYEWRGRFAAFGCNSRVELGVGPVTEILTAKYLNAAGVEVPLAPSAIRIATDVEIEPAVGTEWPVTADGDGVVTITFRAGYADAVRPPSLIAAVRLMLGSLFMNREAVVIGASVDELPIGMAWLCAPYRSVRI